MKHTTGQWNAVAQMPEGYSIETNEGKVIAFTQCDEDYNSENPIIRAEEMANANLIAAAPKLLESCIELLSFIERQFPNEDGEAIYDARQAIEAATK